MTGVEATDERSRRSYQESASPSSSSARSSSPGTSPPPMLQPLLTSSNSNTLSSPPPSHSHESIISSQLTPFTDSRSDSVTPPPVIKSEKYDEKKEDGGSSWSMHLDVLSKLKNESDSWYDSEEMSPEALINSSRSIKNEYSHDESFPGSMDHSNGSSNSPPLPPPYLHHPSYHPFHNPYHHPDPYYLHLQPPPPPFASPYTAHLDSSLHMPYTPPHLSYTSPYFPPHYDYHPPPPLPSTYSPPSPSAALPSTPSPYPLPHTPPGTPHAAPHTPPTPPNPTPPMGAASHIILPKRRGRKPKHVKIEEDNGNLEGVAAAWAEHDAKKRRKLVQSGISATPPPPGGNPPPPSPALTPPVPPPEQQPPAPPVKQRKKMDRFGGMEEEEVAKRTLPDHLKPGLDIVIIGINPGLFAAYKGHHYAGPGNHFWKCLFLSGLIPEPYGAEDDHSLLQHGIGFTNIVARTTKGSADLTRLEIKQGAEILISKLRYYRPRIAVFNGKGIYEIFSGKKDFQFGKQPELFPHTDTYVWVMPSSSARCAQLPRALDKVPFYSALRKFRDYLQGKVESITEEEMTFAHVKLKNFKKEDKILEEEEEEVVVEESSSRDGVAGFNEDSMSESQSKYFRPTGAY